MKLSNFRSTGIWKYVCKVCCVWPKLFCLISRFHITKKCWIRKQLHAYNGCTVVVFVFMDLRKPMNVARRWACFYAQNKDFIVSCCEIHTKFIDIRLKLEWSSYSIYQNFVGLASFSSDFSSGCLLLTMADAIS